MKYNTKQKEIIIETLKKYKEKSISAKELENLLFLKVSKATMYRYLDDMSKENIINKYFNEVNNCYEYQYLDDSCHHHLHLKCMVCGKIIHLNNSFINNDSILLDYNHSLLYGKCQSCIRKD